MQKKIYGNLRVIFSCSTCSSLFYQHINIPNDTLKKGIIYNAILQNRQHTRRTLQIPLIAREEIFRGASHRYKVVIYTVAREESNKTSVILCRHSPRSLANSRVVCKEYITFDLLPHPSPQSILQGRRIHSRDSSFKAYAITRFYSTADR